MSRLITLRNTIPVSEGKRQSVHYGSPVECLSTGPSPLSIERHHRDTDELGRTREVTFVLL